MEPNLALHIQDASVLLPKSIGTDARIEIFFKYEKTDYKVVIWVGAEFPWNVHVFTENGKLGSSDVRFIALAILDQCDLHLSLPAWIVNSVYAALREHIMIDVIQIQLCEPELA